MLVIGRVVRVAVALCIAGAFAGCSSSDEPPVPDATLIDPTTMRGALLQPADIGKTWVVPAQKPSPDALISFCGGDTAAPPTPPGPAAVTSSAVDEGTKGAQTLDQIALVYPDADGGPAGLTMLRAVADTCPPSVTVAAKATEERREPSYSETVAVTELAEGGWSGFVIERHKLYDPKHPAAADTAVAVLQKRNVVLVQSYAIYRLAATGAAPNFAADWQKLVGTVLNRVPA